MTSIGFISAVSWSESSSNCVEIIESIIDNLVSTGVDDIEFIICDDDSLINIPVRLRAKANGIGIKTVIGGVQWVVNFADIVYVLGTSASTLAAVSSQGHDTHIEHFKLRELW